MPTDTTFKVTYKGPWKGIDVEHPENAIDPASSPFLQNFILKHGEIRTRPRQYSFIPGPRDGSIVNRLETFIDSNNVVHTVIVTNSGLWQLNRNWQQLIKISNIKDVWSKVGTFPVQPGPNIPSAISIFVNKFYWTNGGTNLWSWDGITSVNRLGQWPKSTKVVIGQQIVDSNGNWQIVTMAGTTGGAAPAWNVTVGAITSDNGVQWTNNGKPFIFNGGIQSNAIVDATNGVTAGAYFLAELGAHLLMLNTVEGSGISSQNFAQRIRWTPSGIPNIWDPNVNIGAGFNDFLEVPDSVTGVLMIGSTGLIVRANGITEISLGQSGINPFNFNHLWASEHGIGNVYPFSISQYGPIGAFISEDDIYEYSIGGFKDIGGDAHDAIYDDLFAASGNSIATFNSQYQNNYIYLQYCIYIPQGKNTKVWRYCVKDKSWQPDLLTNINIFARPHFVAIT